MARRVKVPSRQRYADSKRIAKQTLRLINAERDLWVFPLVSGVLFLAAIAAMSFGFIRVFMDLAPGDPGVSLRVVSATLAAGVFFLPIAVLTSLLTAAYAWALYQRMEGREVTRRQAWARAWQHIGVIVRFQLIALVVGVVVAALGQLLERVQWIPGVGRVTQTLGSFAWAAAAFFVIPVIVVERERRAWGALTRSVSIGRSQWGKTIAGMVTISLVFLVPMMVVVLAGATLMMYATIVDRFVLAMVGLGVMTCAVALLLLLMPLNMALQTAYQTALYRFAVTGRISAPFGVETMHTVWAPYRGE